MAQYQKRLQPCSVLCKFSPIRELLVDLAMYKIKIYNAAMRIPGLTSMYAGVVETMQTVRKLLLVHGNGYLL